ncbi:MAG: hypothetical protein IIV16_03810 [Alistipes sp.]|nr:hypothetical protein [Alistipes sp.]
MAKYDESEYFTDSQEEIAQREAEEALRRTVRTEIRRIQTGEANADIADDIAREEEEEALKEKKKGKKRRWVSLVNGLFTGDILLAEEASRVYNFLTLLGIIFLITIFAMFATFQQEKRCSDLRAEIMLLKEKAVRTSEERVNRTSHSAIINQLKERGIELEDPTTNPIILR